MTGRAPSSTPLHFAPDGAFPLGDPNPVKQKVVEEGRRAMESGEFLFGTFFDGDGDRVDFYAGDGTMVFVQLCVRRNPAGDSPAVPRSRLGVFADLKSNPLAVMEMARAGVKVDVIRNGHSQIKQSLYDDPARFGAVEESAHFYEAFYDEAPRYCTENSLYITLLAARRGAGPERFARLLDIQRQTSREREWGYKFPTDRQRSEALLAVREHFESLGASAMERMRNGMDLEATLMRRGLPLDIDENTSGQDWLQVCQRISHSENGLARWEVPGADANIVSEAKRHIGGVRTAIRCGERVSRVAWNGGSTGKVRDGVWLVIAAVLCRLVGPHLVGRRCRRRTPPTTTSWLAATWAGSSSGRSIFASNIGSEHLVGLAGSGCTDGVAMAHYELHAWCLLVLAWVWCRSTPGRWSSRCRSS